MEKILVLLEQHGYESLAEFLAWLSDEETEVFNKMWFAEEYDKLYEHLVSGDLLN